MHVRDVSNVWYKLRVCGWEQLGDHPSLRLTGGVGEKLFVGIPLYNHPL